MNRTLSLSIACVTENDTAPPIAGSLGQQIALW
jgi:hypothetical protein